jgi:hypothetical protein
MNDQRSVTEQLKDLIGVANKMGLYDAADFLLNTVTNVAKKEATADAVQAPTQALLSDYEEREMLKNDFNSAIYLFKRRTGCTDAEAKHIILSLALSMGLIARESVKRFMGGCDEKSLPIKKGMVVTIKKGTMIHTIGKEPRPAGRTYKVTVNHVTSGYTQHRAHHGDIVPSQNPTIVWPGTGGYWTSADINDIPEAQEPSNG